MLIHARNIISVKARRAKVGFDTLEFTLTSDLARGFGINEGDILTIGIVKVEKAKA